jgi:hypothetical protein
MAIDPLNENLILPREAPALFPPGPNGKRIHTSAIYRYMSKGARGVVLESLNSPRKCTSKQAVARFLVSLSNHDRAPDPIVGAHVARERENRDVERALDRLGIY